MKARLARIAGLVLAGTLVVSTAAIDQKSKNTDADISATVASGVTSALSGSLSDATMGVAGVSGMDVARTALRHGAKKVTVFSRSDHLAASQREVDYAKIDGVEFVVHVEPVEIVDDGVIFVELECDGKGNLSPIRGTENLYQADSKIIAISQGPKDRIVSTTTGLEVNEKGLLVTNTFGETTRDGIFASGDVVRGAKTVVEAVAYSKQVADAMDDYMKGLMHERDL